MKNTMRSAIAATLLAGVFSGCSSHNAAVESPAIANYLKAKESHEEAWQNKAEPENINAVKPNSSTIFSAVRSISARTGKVVVTAGEDLPIQDDLKFLNYQDISDYIQAKGFPYKVEIENYPRFDKVAIVPLDAVAFKLKNTPVSITGSLSGYLEVQNIAQALNLPLSADAYSIQALSKDAPVAFSGSAYNFLELLADQNNLFFVVEDGKIALRQYDERIFPVTITPLSIETKSMQSLKTASGNGTSQGVAGATSATTTTAQNGSTGQNATTANQTVSYEIYKELEQTVKNIVGENGAYHLNQASGQLFVRTKHDNMKMAKKIIDNFNEVYSKIIEIRMTIVEVNLDDKFEAGIDLSAVARNLSANLKGAAIATTGSTLTIGGSLMSADGLKMTSAISALKEFGNTKVTSKTVSTTINSIPTYGVSSTEQDYISELSQTQSGTSVATSTWSTKKSTAVDGLSFHLFPRVNPDGKIVLTIQPKLTKHLALEPFSPSAGNYVQNETRNQKEFTSTVILEDGGTAIIAGISSDSEDKNKQGLPFVSENDHWTDFVGGSRSNKNSHSEIVVFVTAHVSK